MTKGALNIFNAPFNLGFQIVFSKKILEASNEIEPEFSFKSKKIIGCFFDGKYSQKLNLAKTNFSVTANQFFKYLLFLNLTTYLKNNLAGRVM